MAFGPRLISLISLSSLAVLLCSFSTPPVTALSVEVTHHARGLHDHSALAKRKRSAKKTKRCKPKAAPPQAASAPPATSTKPATKPAPAPAPAPAHPSSGGNGQLALFGGSDKRFMAWPNGGQGLHQWNAIKGLYTWSPACPSNAKALGITCCPMLWGHDQIQQFVDTVNANTPTCVMGPNEPEIAGQSNMSPPEAAGLWEKYIFPLAAKGVHLITPATTSDPNGKKWMMEFFDACKHLGKNCGAHTMAKHWYDVHPQNFIDLLEDHHNTFGMDIAVTEFACQNFNGGPQCNEAEVWNLQTQMTAYFWQTSFIKAYAPFGAMQNMQGVNTLNQLMNPDGGPTPLAKAYYNL